MPKIDVIRLRSIDGHLFALDIDLALMSTKIRQFINNGVINAGNQHQYMNVALKSWTLYMITEWCEQHKYDMRGAVGGDSSKLDQFDRNFFNKRLEILYELFLASDYLQIEPLVDATFNALKSQLYIHSRQQLFQMISEKRF